MTVGRAAKTLNRLLLKAGVWITAVVGTMWTALFFLLVAIGATPGIGIPLGITAACTWFAQVVCQLVLLPIIMVGQNLQGAKSEALLLETHDTVMAELAELRAFHEEARHA